MIAEQIRDSWNLDLSGNEGTGMYPRGITAPGWCVYAGTVNFIYIKYQALRISYEAGAQISVTAGHILSEKSKP